MKHKFAAILPEELASLYAVWFFVAADGTVVAEIGRPTVLGPTAIPGQRLTTTGVGIDKACGMFFPCAVEE